MDHFVADVGAQLLCDPAGNVEFLDEPFGDVSKFENGATLLGNAQTAASGASTKG
jgi:hypothetical protein